MKKLSKVLVLVLSAIMVLAMSASVFAAAPATGTITVTPPAGATGENTYTIYKVFDATVGTDGAVAYKLLSGLTDDQVPEGFTATRGYITAAPDSLSDTTEAFKNYAHKVSAGTITTNGTTAGRSGELEPGYYYIETSTGAAVIVTPGGDAQVEDKNVLSDLTKTPGTEYDENSKKAIAAVGTHQPFTIVVTKKHGADKLIVTDTMSKMKYDKNATFTVSDGSTPVVNKEETDNGFTFTFGTDYVKGLQDGATITINYTAEITAEALADDPATNTATLNPGANQSVDTNQIYTAKITINKVDGDGEPLSGAGFTLYKKTANGEDVVETITTGTTFEFKNLLPGEYRVEETTVPGGYNKAADETFTIAADDFTATNLAQSRDVVNQAGAVLPTTGGIGTTIFYVLGSLLVVGCGIVLVSRKRMQNNK